MNPSMSGRCMGWGGTWGAIATGIFASAAVNSAGAAGLLFGNVAQLLKQMIGVGAVWTYVFIATMTIGKIVDAIIGLRVKEECQAVVETICRVARTGKVGDGSLGIEVHKEFVGMGPQPYSIHLLFLQLQPCVDKVWGEYISFKQELLVLLQG